MKRLIVCFDGTWNTADNGGAPTNVVRLARMIPPDDGANVKQLVFYDQGVGTGNAVDKLVGGAIGQGLEQHIKQGYLFLSQNYERGDEIFIFGFSRGAFAARSLGGFIGANRGLLKRDKLYKLEDAWRLYRTPPRLRNTFFLFNEIQTNVHEDVRIKFMGVWDTVGSLGIPTDLFNSVNRRKYAFHDTALSPLIENAFQAVAIDEKRGPFAPTLWKRPPKPTVGQVVEQTWFAGVHADVGGGYENSELSDLTLRWMMGRVTAHTGLKFDGEKVAYFLPDASLPGSVALDADIAAKGVRRIEEKWKGTLHNSLGFYLASRIMPRVRAIAGYAPESGPGPIPKLYRLAGNDAMPAFCEKLHWSAVDRLLNWRTAGIPEYSPHNLRAAIDKVPIQSREEELKAEKPWFSP